MNISLSDGARRFLAERGYDPAFGARPLKRVIQRELQDPLALHVLEGRLKEGEHVFVDVDRDHLVFETVVPESVAA